jgi:hypothetical protein
MRNWMVALVLIGCGKKGPVIIAGPEQDVVSHLAAAITDQPRKAVELYDLELRQKIDLYQEVTAAPGEQRLKLFETAQPRIGDVAALDTLRAELSSELLRGEFAKSLIGNKCAWGLPSQQDGDLYANYELPQAKPEMGQKIGMFVFELNKDITVVTKGRVSCPGGVSAWMQLVKRKGPNAQLKILRIKP